MRLARFSVLCGFGVAAGLGWSACALATEGPADQSLPPASAAPPKTERSPLESTFDNTVRAKTASLSASFYFNRDGTFTARGPGPEKFGTWHIEGDKICTHLKGSPDSCGDIALNRKVGTKWTQFVDGDTVELEIVFGR